MTFVELHQRWIAKRDAFNAHPTGEGKVGETLHRVLNQLLDRPPVLRTKSDALTALEFLEHELVEVRADDGLVPLLKRLRGYIEGGAS